MSALAWLLLSVQPAQALTPAELATLEPLIIFLPVAIRNEARTCLANEPWSTRPDPDVASASSRLTDIERSLGLRGPGVIRSVVNHDGRSTNSSANEGIAAYMSDSVQANPVLFLRALRFYAELSTASGLAPIGYPPLSESCERAREIPVRYNFDRDFLPIHFSSTGAALALARNATGGDEVTASQILSLYGHDNKVQTLGGSSCRIRLMNQFRPRPDSILYRQGSIGVPYTSAQISEGNSVARRCYELFCSGIMDSVMFDICNDRHREYEGDYYHVIASRFLGCRALRGISSATAQTTGGALASLLDEATTEGAYLESVIDYKATSFQMGINASEANVPLAPLLLAFLQNVRNGLMVRDGKIREGTIAGRSVNIALGLGSGVVSSLVADQDHLIARAALNFERGLAILHAADHITANEIRVGQAIISRYIHEIRFRRDQHRAGFEAGARACNPPPVSCPHLRTE